MIDLTRRLRLAMVLLLSCLVLSMTPSSASGSPASSPASHPYADADDVPTTTPIKHFVTVMQSNHSFDSLFGTYPGADGIPDGVCMPANPEDELNTECVEPFQLTNNGADLNHTHATFNQQYRDGNNDGFVYSYRLRGEDGQIAMGHYTEADLPFSYNVADEYVLYDRFFTSASAGSVPNRMFWTTGTPGFESIDNPAIPDEGWTDLPSIFDRLEDAGIPWKFYIENYDPSKTFRNRGDGATYAQVNWAPILSFPRHVDDPDFSSHIVDLEQYFVDLENNELPAVSYVVTIGSSGHPPSSMLSSERMLRRMVNALMMSEAWDTSAIQWAYDDWGGWYDHVSPPQIDNYGYGFRTPAMLVSPYARQGYIDSETHDFTSILAFIEQNWSLAPLATRDREAISIATAMDFSQEPRPPRLIAMSSEAPEMVIPRRSPIHVTYSVAIVSAGAVIVAAFATGRLRRRGSR